jgi:thioredoxin reductase (NADPH)
MNHVRLAIIGSGPAGLTAAIYAARGNLEPVLFEGVEAGGQLTTTTEVENYPGFPQGIQGPELMEAFRQQAERFGTKFVRGDVLEVDLSRRPFVIRFHDGEYLADAIIISTGARSKLLGLENEKKLIGRGVSTCATCDGFFFRGQEIAVVGGGDSAIEEANFLSKFALKVHLIHRRDKLRASKIMQDRLFVNPRVQVHWDRVVHEILADEQGLLRGVTLQDPRDGALSDLKVSGLFVAIGHVPNTTLFRGKIDLDENGYILLNGRGTQTNVEGVFASGDVADHVYRQAVTAAGTGCQAAIDAERWLESQNHSSH